MFRKKFLKTGFVDIHCHLVPMVDDGAKDMGTALAMARLAYEEGIRTIVATPHYHQNKVLCSEEEVQERFENFRIQAEKTFPELTILYGREIYMTYDAMEMLEKKKIPLTVCNSSYILAEFDVTTDYSYMKNLLQNVMLMGYLPILAHIERYKCLLEHEERIEELKSMNVVMQVNSMSVMGASGKNIQKYLKKLLKKELVDIIATDAHTTEKRAPKMKETACYIEKKFGTDTMERLLIHNPNKIIQGKYLEE